MNGTLWYFVCSKCIFNPLKFFIDQKDPQIFSFWLEGDKYDRLSNVYTKIRLIFVEEIEVNSGLTN